MMKTNKQLKVEAREKYHREWKKKKYSSSTPGKTKREDTCQATRNDKFFAKYSRGRKAPGYIEWCVSHTGK